jgi:hypothetical protein
MKYSTDFIPYTIGVSTDKNVIDQKRNVIELQPGFKTIISVTPKFINTSDNFDRLSVSDRNCILPHETVDMKMINKYSRIGCEVECAVNKSISICRCMPWYYPNSFYEVPICDMFGGYCFEHFMSNPKSYSHCRDVCLDDCNGMQLTISVASKPIAIDKVCTEESPLYKYLEKYLTKNGAVNYTPKLAFS